MQVKTIETFKYSELSDAAKAKARDWFREASIGDNYFAGAVIEDAETIGKLMGLTIAERTYKTVGGKTGTEPAVWWSLHVQGSGASFDGTWRAASVKPGGVKDYAGQDAELHRIAAEFERIAAQYPEASFTVKTGWDAHSRAAEFDCDPGDYEDHCEKLPDTQGPCEAWEAAFPEEALTEAARDFMDWIYRQLNKEYDYRQSDEVVAEDIEANEYDFTADGKREVIL
jgi:hypothetical protein